MKFLPSQFAYLLSQREARRNLKSLGKFTLVLIAIILAFAEVFHLIMEHVEHQDHSWVTGLYWTLTVMSTLGFGDITFQSDLGRAFSILVLVAGVVLLLIVLPFTFIRFFYAPWLEAQIRLRAPRTLPEHVNDHVVIARYDDVARALIARLEINDVPYVALESDPSRAGHLRSDGVSVVAGDIDNVSTYGNARTTTARLVLANDEDATNCNITLTVRECAPDVPILAFVEDADAVDILEMSGATRVVPLKHRLGEHLAGRVTAGPRQCQVVGNYRDLLIAEFPVHGTMLVGRTLRDTRLRELTGLNVVGYWDRGNLHSAGPDSVLTENSVAVVSGTQDQIDGLNAMFVIYRYNENPVVVLGGGKVGRAAVRALKQRDLAVHMVEKDRALEPRIASLADKVVFGNAADRQVLAQAGLDDAPSVVLTTNDDAVNIYLAIYCRKINPDIRIVSRITHERNLEAIHRAGADFVLGYTSLATRYVTSFMQSRDLVILGEGVDLFLAHAPAKLAGKTLAQLGIGAKTGLNVIGIEGRDGRVQPATAQVELERGAELVMIGTAEQRQRFREAFE